LASRLAGNMTGAIAAVDGGRTRDLAVHVTPITFVSRPPKSLRQKLAHGCRFERFVLIYEAAGKSPPSFERLAAPFDEQDF